MIRCAILIGLLLVFAGSVSAQGSQAAAAIATERRVALVIGNAAYKAAPLSNPVNDATDMASALQAAGFKVILKRNVSAPEMRRAIRAFGAELRRAQVGLFYFAGHGVQVKGNNYLVPVAADIQSEADVEDSAIDASYALRTMEEAQVQVSIVILDACRNNPFARSFRSTSRGLAQMTAATGSLVAFATAPGAVAADGAGRNGVYTKHLLASLREADTDVLRVFQRTRAAVVKETDGKQTPWESTSLIGDFYFRPPAGGVQFLSVAPSSPVAPADPANERAFWDSVKDSKEPDELNAYVVQYPSGLFVSLALSRLKLLQSTQVLASTQPSDIAAAHQQAELGLKYAYGSGGLTKDDAEAVRLYRLAANQGNASARLSLGYMYAYGRGGLRKDDAEAVSLFRLAANQGNAQAQSYLGEMYSSGRGGLTKDDAQAVSLFRLAANQGNAQAQSYLGEMYASGRGGLTKDDVEAVRLYRLAADQGDAGGQNNLGLMYEAGRGGLTRGDVEAVRLFKLTANQGNAVGQTGLGAMYEAGRGGLRKDDVEAVRLYKLAADQGFARGQVNLGVMYASGRGGLTKDDAEAVRLFKLAADQGDALGQNNLGFMHEIGRAGLTRDVEMAVHWYELAAKQSLPIAINNLVRLGRR